MVSTAPSHCPHCGGDLGSLARPGRYRCLACEEYVFHNPSPNARVVVLDGEAALLVEIADWSRIEDAPDDEPPTWMTPGGHPELGEQPDAAAARELEEETDLEVAPADLTLFDAVARQVVPEAHAVVLFYAVERGATRGSLSAASDAAAARFWEPAELAAADGRYREMHEEPAAYRSFENVVGMAREALDGGG